jgi:hypothetical protein
VYLLKTSSAVLRFLDQQSLDNQSNLSTILHLFERSVNINLFLYEQSDNTGKRSPAVSHRYIINCAVG